MKDKITKEEYLQLLEEREFLINEKKTLESLINSDNYIAHVPLGGNFGQLLMNVKRDTEEIDEQLKKTKENFIEQYNDKETKETLNSKIDRLTKILYETTPLVQEETSDKESLELDSEYEEFNKFYLSTKELVYRKKTNAEFSKLITNYQDRYEDATNKIQQYERHNKIKNLFHRNKKASTK